MTAALFDIDAKVCANPRCRRTFFRLEGQTQTSWVKQAYCCGQCGNSFRKSGGTAPSPASRAPKVPVVQEYRADTTWRHRARCSGEDPELFQPVASCGPMYEAQVAEAKAVCRRCPVRDACLAEALARIPHGILGGLTEDERRGLAQVVAS